MTEQKTNKAPAKRRTTTPKKEVVPLSAVEQSFQLMQMAIERGASPEEIKALMDMRRELQAEQAACAFREAKAGFLSAIPMIKKSKVAKFPTKNGGEMSYNYASIDDIVESIKPHLVEFGLSYHWEQRIEEGVIVVKCVLTHKGGHQESMYMHGMLDNSGSKNAIQAVASTSTYLRRYTLTGILGIATADPDLDGRLPQTYDNSDTLDDILSEGEKQCEAIREQILAAADMGALNEAGSLIGELPESTHKENLKSFWFQARKKMEGLTE